MRLPLDNLVVCLFDENGGILCSNDAHAAMLGRGSESLIGRNWRDWTSTDQLASSENAFLRCLAGEPVNHMRVVTRPDGTLLLGPSQLLATQHSQSRVVVATMKLMVDTADLVRPDARAVAEYVSDLSGEMAKMALSAGLKTLGAKLDDAAQQAGELTALLAAAHGRSH